MKRALFGMMAFVAGVALITSPAISQPPEGKGGKDGKGTKGMKGGFKLGTALPPFMVDELKLTDDQKVKLAEIEKDLKAKLDKLLTDEQKKTLENFRPGGPGGPGGGPGGPGGPGGKGGKGGEPPPFDDGENPVE